MEHSVKSQLFSGGSEELCKLKQSQNDHLLVTEMEQSEKEVMKKQSSQ